MGIGDKIKKARTKKGLTQEELSVLLKVSRSTVSNWEIERNAPDISLLTKLSDVLDISLQDLLSEDTALESSGTSSTLTRVDQRPTCSDKQQAEYENRSSCHKAFNNRKLRQFCTVLLVLAVCILFFYVSTSAWGLSSSGQIKSAQIRQDSLEIELSLPPLLSASDYFMEWDESGLITVDIQTKLAPIHPCHHISIPLSRSERQARTIQFASHGETIKTLPVTNS